MTGCCQKLWIVRQIEAETEIEQDFPEISAHQMLRCLVSAFGDQPFFETRKKLSFLSGDQSSAFSDAGCQIINLFIDGDRYILSYGQFEHSTGPKVSSEKCALKSVTIN